MESIISYFNLFLPIVMIGGASVIFYFLVRDPLKKSKKKLDINKIFDQNTKEELDSVQTEETKVIAKIKDLQKKSIDQQKEIKKVIDDAAVKIDRISKKTTVEEVDSTIDDNWEDMGFN